MLGLFSLDPETIMSTRRANVALVIHGDRKLRDSLVLADTPFSQIADALSAAGLNPVAAVYNDAFAEEVRQQLLTVDAALVCVNPLTEDGDRSLLDELLRHVARQGVIVSAHPDTILKMGTKEVLYTTRHLPWGSDVRLYRTLDALGTGFPAALLSGPRVVKQYRGNGGNGVFRVELAEDVKSVLPDTLLKVRHASRGSAAKTMAFDAFVDSMARNFAGDGRLVDQAWQPRMTEGMIRCYFVRNKVEGFGEQLINALYPDTESGEPVQRGPRLYYPPKREDLQRLKQQIESDWLPAMQRHLDVANDALPVIWDADLFRGPKDAHGEDTWVLCEINISAVYPFPDECLEPLARETARRLAARG